MPSGEVTAHYEAGLGIRPPHKRGKVRGVAREIVPGGGMELWHCGHDHAPGVRDCRKLTPDQRGKAMDCAEKWLRAKVAAEVADGLPAMPITRDDE